MIYMGCLITLPHVLKSRLDKDNSPIGVILNCLLSITCKYNATDKYSCTVN